MSDEQFFTYFPSMDEGYCVSGYIERSDDITNDDSNNHYY